MNCKYCGAPLDIGQKSLISCDYCGKNNTISQIGDGPFNLEDFYDQLYEAAAINKIHDIKKFSSIINEKTEGSFASKYFELYADYRLKNRNELVSFLGSYLGDVTPTDETAIEHLIQHGELKDKKAISRFIKKNAPERLKKYNDVYSQRIKREDNYAKVPRDVFICFSNSNVIIANRIVKILEAESISCWISSRNLREQGLSNYWDDILSAISRSKVVVLVSSEAEMNSPDVAKELDYANEINKRIVEFKIDLTPHNLTFKHLFSGNRWIDATSDIDKGYLALKTRIFNELKQLQKSSKSISEIEPDLEKPTQKNHSPKTLIYTYYSLLTILLIAIILGLRWILPGLGIELIPFDFELLLT
jgi:hypothetical protein